MGDSPRGRRRAKRVKGRSGTAPKRRPRPSGVKMAEAASWLSSSPGISRMSALALSGWRAPASSATFAPSEGSTDRRPLDLEVVEQRHRLVGEARHRVVPRALGAVGVPVAEEIEREYAAAPFREPAR